MLLGAQNVACTPDLQIPHGDAKAGAKAGEFPDSGQTLGGHIREGFAPGKGQVGKSPPVGAAHPPPQLIQLGEAHPVGVFNDEGVAVGDVHPGLDDGGTH